VWDILPPGGTWDVTIRADAPALLLGPEPFALLLASVFIIILLARPALARIGFTRGEALLVFAAAPLLAGTEIGFARIGDAYLAMNVAGCVIPLVIGLKVMIAGRAPAMRALLAIVVVGGVSYLSSYAIPSEGVLLYYRVPAIVAGLAGIVLSLRKPSNGGPLAFTAGAWGVFLGADGLHLSELLYDGTPHRIVLGGAGVLDGIFIVAVLAVLLPAIAVAGARFARTVSGRDASGT